jgi:hypothetical protein
MSNVEFLFGATSRESETAFRDFLDRVESWASAVVDAESPAVLVLDEEPALLVAWMVEIGVAPKRHALVDALRQSVTAYGAASLEVTPGAAETFIEVLQSGIARHEAGVTDADVFRLH